MSTYKLRNRGWFKVAAYGTPQFREKLLGGFYLGEDGKIEIQEGALLKAIRQGKSLLIKGISWAGKLRENFRVYPAPTAG